MVITVRLFATLRAYHDKEFALEVQEGASPASVVEQLQLPKQDIAIIMINGRGVKENTPLCDGDVLALFPAVGGG